MVGSLFILATIYPSTPLSVCSNPPAWKLLIADTLPPNERIPLITSIFSDRDELDVFKYLPTDDAQSFIDVIDEVGVFEEQF